MKFQFHTQLIPRINEINGKDYFFISEDDFKKLIDEGELLEHAKYLIITMDPQKKKYLNIWKMVKMYYLTLIGKVQIKLKKTI